MAKKCDHYKKVLIIAGSDSGAGAGIQADLKTVSSLGCYGTTAITALTAQNTVGVKAISAIPASFVKKQLCAILDDIGTDSIKIGMLHQKSVIKIVGQTLRDYALNHKNNIVLDPVMISTSGHALLKDSCIHAIIKELFPLATLITPNLQESCFLLQQKIKTKQDYIIAAKKLHQLGALNVLIKGGDDNHNQKEALDLLYLGEEDQLIWFKSPKIKTVNTHGTGCTLSSAIASYLALGHSLKESVQLSKKYITEVIYAGKNYHLGQGHGPVHHFYSFWR